MDNMNNPMVQRNLTLLINDINGLRYLLSMGYKALICTEDMMPQDIEVHPNVIKVSVLLPPYEVVSLEVDHMYDTAAQQFQYYLSTNPSCVSICDIVYISAYKGMPLVLYMGSEYNDLMSVQAIPTYMANFMGLMFVPYGAASGSLNLAVAPRVLTTEYLSNNFGPMEILSYYPPDMDIPVEILSKLITDLNPPIMQGDFESANKYFKDTIRILGGKATNEYGQKYYMPFKGGSYSANGGQK